MTDAPLIRARGLCKFYGEQKRVEVLRDLDLDVAAGRALVIVGQSGVGKSTLLHLLGALDTPSAGEVTFDGVSLTSLGERELAAFRNREIGFIFQFHHLLPDFSALENVMLPQLVAGRGRVEARERGLGLLARLGLAERATHRPGRLSGGEQQRVAIARALANAPAVVLADEPTGNLDLATADRVFAELVEVVRDSGTAALVATHNPELAARMDRTLTIRDGRIEPL